MIAKIAVRKKDGKHRLRHAMPCFETCCGKSYSVLTLLFILLWVKILSFVTGISAGDVATSVLTFRLKCFGECILLYCSFCILQGRKWATEQVLGKEEGLQSTEWRLWRTSMVKRCEITKAMLRKWAKQLWLFWSTTPAHRRNQCMGIVQKERPLGVHTKLHWSAQRGSTYQFRTHFLLNFMKC